VDELVLRQPIEVAASARAVGLHDPDEERVTAEKRVAPGLTVAAPELLARADPAEGSGPDPARDCPERRVEPYDEVGSLEDAVAELAVVTAVRDPAG